jgi:hypothetical protein
MQYTDDRYHLRVTFQMKDCSVPADELTRMQTSLAPLGEIVWDFPQSDLTITITFHPRSLTYHVETQLRLPGRTLRTGDWDAYLDSAFQRGIRKLSYKAQAYCDHPNKQAGDVAERRAAIDRDIVAPEDPDSGPIGAAVQEGDYRTFRTALAGYEEWLGKRVGRWLERYPEAEAKVSKGLKIGDLVEEVYLNAFEEYRHRSVDVRLSQWLEGLIDPSLKALLRHPDEEAENASMARTLRETPLS